MQDLNLEFSDKKVTPWGGMHWLARLLDKIKFREMLSKQAFPEPGSNRSYEAYEVIEPFLVSIWAGANRFSHTSSVFYDSVLPDIFNWKKVPSPSTFNRFFTRFNQKTNNKVFPAINKWFIKECAFNDLTLDLDSTVMTRYGEQEGAAKGYNPTKPGRKSHHPLMAFLGRAMYGN